MGRKFSNFLVKNHGDADVKSSDGNRRIDPALKFYSGIPLMINHNRDLVKTGRAKGTLCRGHSLKMKHKYNLR